VCLGEETNPGDTVIEANTKGAMSLTLNDVVQGFMLPKNNQGA
jgi:hypothetical protein